MDVALESQRRAAKAMNCGAFSLEIVPVRVASRKESIMVSEDENPRPQTTLEALAKLRPVFLQENGTVTAGNASGLNDGAAILAITSREYAREAQLPILAEYCHMLQSASTLPQWGWGR